MKAQGDFGLNGGRQATQSETPPLRFAPVGVTLFRPRRAGMVGGPADLSVSSSFFS